MQLLFFRAALREAVDRIGSIGIRRVDVRIVRMMRIETIGEQEIDRARSIVRFTLRRCRGGSSRYV